MNSVTNLIFNRVLIVEPVVGVDGQDVEIPVALPAQPLAQLPTPARAGAVLIDCLVARFRF